MENINVNIAFKVKNYWEGFGVSTRGYWPGVGNVFRLPIRQNKFFGTIEFFVSILDLNIQICRPFVPCKISHISLWKTHVKIIRFVYGLPFPFALLITIVLALEPDTPCC
jgi:hypothetical protein